MNELSQTLKNFITEFELKALPYINKSSSDSGHQPMSITVSTATLKDPQLRELLGISPGQQTGKFLGVSVGSAPDMEVELFGDLVDKKKEK